MVTNIILAVTTVLIFLLGLLVYLNNKKSSANKFFFLFTISVVIWSATNLLTNLSVDPSLSLFWSKMAIVGAALLIYFFLLFSFYFPLQRKLSIQAKVWLFIPTSIFIALSPTSLNVSSATAHGQQVTVGPLYYLMALYLPIYILWSGYNFVHAYRHSQGQKKEQIFYVFVAIIFSFGPGFILNAIAPLIGYPQLASLGPIFVLFFVAMITYAMLRKRLLDIRLLVARSLTYILSIVTIAAVYGFLAFRVITLFTEHLSQNTQYAIFTILAVILAFTFAPLKRFFERVTDRIFFRDKYDPQTVINSIGRILASEIQLERLVDKVISELTAEMRIARADIVVVGEKSIFYQNTAKASRHDYELRDLKKLGKSIIVADDLASGERKDILAKYGTSVSLALRTSEEFIGYLLLGEKLSGDIYNDGDIKVLRIIANELAIAIQNAKSYAEIQRFNETLQVKITQATKKLHVANDNLKELDKAKDEFISMASHQLRTPLTTTKGYVSMVLEEDFGKISKAQIEPLQQALDSANRMGGLVNDLLNVSRMDAGKFFIDAHEIDLAKVVQSEVDGLQTMAASKNVKLAYQPPAKTLPPINLDEEKTRQVVMNLVDNAIHYSSPTKTDSAVKVSLQQDGQDVVFKVVDNGIGVPEQMKQKLFTKFYRASNAQAARPDGTGLGLYLVKRVVEDQGGQLIFESKEGEGSTFGFRFPLKTKFKAGVTKARVELSSSN